MGLQFSIGPEIFKEVNYQLHNCNLGKELDDENTANE